jgi:hypothetical protein
MDDPVRQFIDEIGGYKEVAFRLGITTSAVSMWFGLGAIPPRYSIRLRNFARERGTEAPDSLFEEVSKVARRGKVVA